LTGVIDLGENLEIFNQGGKLEIFNQGGSLEIFNQGDKLYAVESRGASSIPS